MPRTRTLEVGGEPLVNEVMMASGLLVSDVLGWRPMLYASWEWMPADTMQKIVNIARAGQYVSIQYPDSTGEDKEGSFKISIGSQRIFKFVNGAPMWYNVELTATSQGVISNADA